MITAATRKCGAIVAAERANNVALAVCFEVQWAQGVAELGASFSSAKLEVKKLYIWGRRWIRFQA